MYKYTSYSLVVKNDNNLCQYVVFQFEMVDNFASVNEALKLRNNNNNNPFPLEFSPWTRQRSITEWSKFFL